MWNLHVSQPKWLLPEYEYSRFFYESLELGVKINLRSFFVGYRCSIYQPYINNFNRLFPAEIKSYFKLNMFYLPA